LAPMKWLSASHVIPVKDIFQVIYFLKILEKAALVGSLF